MGWAASSDSVGFYCESAHFHERSQWNIIPLNCAQHIYSYKHGNKDYSFECQIMAVITGDRVYSAALVICRSQYLFHIRKKSKLKIEIKVIMWGGVYVNQHTTWRNKNPPYAHIRIAFWWHWTWWKMVKRGEWVKSGVKWWNGVKRAVCWIGMILRPPRGVCEAHLLQVYKPFVIGAIPTKITANLRRPPANSP